MSGTDRIFGLSWDEIQAAQQGKPYRRKVLMTPCDYGSDPLPDGMFRMVPSGDVVSKEERDARLKERRIADHLNERVGPKDPTYHGLSLDELARGESYHPGDDA